MDRTLPNNLKMWILGLGRQRCFEGKNKKARRNNEIDFWLDDHLPKGNSTWHYATLKFHIDRIWGVIRSFSEKKIKVANQSVKWRSDKEITADET